MTVPPSSRRVLVTGGAGFIGSHLCEYLASSGHSVTVIDDLSTGSLANVKAARQAGGDIEFIHQRVSAAIPGLKPESFSAIYHLAAAVGVRLVLERTSEAIERNVLDTAAILRFARGASLPVFIASSSEVYGKGTKTPFSEDMDVAYGPTTALRWSYACSKAIDEYLALAHHRESGLPCVITRFFNTIGPRQTGRYGMVLPRFVRAALAGTPLEVHGDGQQSRCFCDVRDVVPAIALLMDRCASRGEVFNLGSDRPMSIMELAHTVIRELGSQSEVRLVPYSEAFGAGFEDLRVRQPDLTKARAAIGFNPTISMATSIASIASHFATASKEAVG
ncbi:MAG: NAD-dependent epimerase/dehydratase family protein [Phycisphaerales bacterium]|nr:NAD-dependent epimerase/dehydratase family protein [Phycisphaerales bacterium]